MIHGILIKDLIDKKRVLKALACPEESSVYKDTANLLEKTLTDLEHMVEVWTGIEIIPLKEPYTSIIETNAGSKLGIAGISLGDRITEKSRALFEQGDYLEGYLMDLATDELIFQISNVVKKELEKKLQLNTCGQVRIISPGDGDVPLVFQKHILADLKKRGSVPIEITDNMMLKPVKSMLFIVGVTRNQETSSSEHFCQKCFLTNCLFREESSIEITLPGKENSTFRHCKENNLLTTLLQKINVPSPCGGNGICGKCVIRVVEGQLKITDADRRLFSEEELSRGYRLACCAYPDASCSISLEFEVSKECDAEIGFISSVDKPKSRVKLINVVMDEKPPSYAGSALKQLLEVTGVNASFSLKTLKRFSEIVGGSSKNENATLALREGTVIAAFSEPVNVYGLTLDIGTTTIAMALVNLETGELTTSHAVMNLQNACGADVITRIQFASKSPDHLKKIKQKLEESLRSGIRELCETADVEMAQIMETVIVGNTTMVHLMLGLECHSLGQSPFTPVTISGHYYSMEELCGIEGMVTPAMVLPSVSAFIGSDLIAGLLNCDIHRDSEISLLIDLGTNGEIAMGHKDKILCLSTAAGPALEGASISRGMASVRGAINTVHFESNIVKFTTIGGDEPAGICGSGAVDIVRGALEKEIIDETGKIVEEYQGTITIAMDKKGNPIVFTQKDVREVQLAKAAIRTGIDILIKQFGCREEEIKKVCLSGGFGNRTNQKSLLATGILPSIFEDRIIPVGNGALGGAVKVLMNRDSQNDFSAIIDSIKHIEISQDPEFNDLFVDHMNF